MFLMSFRLRQFLGGRDIGQRRHGNGRLVAEGAIARVIDRYQDARQLQQRVVYDLHGGRRHRTLAEGINVGIERVQLLLE